VSPKPKPRLADLLGEPETRQTMSSNVAARLRDLIVTGKLEAGTVLPLRELASSLGVSVMPVREALRYLESDGLVTVDSNRHASVATLSADDVEELYAIRGALEGLAARLGTVQLAADGQEDLSRMFAEMEDDVARGDVDAFVRHDRAFHIRLYESAGRPRLVDRIQSLQASSARALPLVFRAWQLQVALDDHRPILAAIRAGDPALVETRTREHLDQAADRVITILRTSQER